VWKGVIKMGFKIERKGILTCDDCGMTMETTSCSNMYGFYKVSIAKLYQSGNGSHADFELINPQEKYYCYDCFEKRFR
jgi:hypothetical protein